MQKRNRSVTLNELEAKWGSEETNDNWIYHGNKYELTEEEQSNVQILLPSQQEGFNLV